MLCRSRVSLAAVCSGTESVAKHPVLQPAAPQGAEVVKLPATTRAGLKEGAS